MSEQEELFVSEEAEEEGEDPNDPSIDESIWTGDTLTYDYNRTIVGYHGTRLSTARRLVEGEPFIYSRNNDDWLGHGIYFWEYAPKQAWDWAVKRYGRADAAVVGAMIRLGRCLDLLDPENGQVLLAGHDELKAEAKRLRVSLPKNRNKFKYLDCAVFNYVYQSLADGGYHVETCRAVFVPTQSTNRYWTRSGLSRVHTSRYVFGQQ